MKFEIQEKYFIMKTMTEKEYDCVKSIRKERDRIAKDTEGKTVDEILEYFKRKRKRGRNEHEFTMFEPK